MLPGEAVPELSRRSQIWKKEEQVCSHEILRHKGTDIADRAWKRGREFRRSEGWCWIQG